MTLPVHRLQHPVLLSRLVVLDHPHHCNVTYNVNNGIQYVASQAEQNASEVGSPPSYSEALLDQRCVCWVAEVGGGRLLMGKAEYVPTPGSQGLPGACQWLIPNSGGPLGPRAPRWSGAASARAPQSPPQVTAIRHAAAPYTNRFPVPRSCCRGPPRPRMAVLRGGQQQAADRAWAPDPRPPAAPASPFADPPGTTSLRLPTPRTPSP